MATTSDGTANSTSMHTNGVGPRELCMLVSSLTTKATVESEMRAALQCLRGRGVSPAIIDAAEPSSRGLRNALVEAARMPPGTTNLFFWASALRPTSGMGAATAVAGGGGEGGPRIVTETHPTTGAVIVRDCGSGLAYSFALTAAALLTLSEGDDVDGGLARLLGPLATMGPTARTGTLTPHTRRGSKDTPIISSGGVVRAAAAAATTTTGGSGSSGSATSNGAGAARAGTGTGGGGVMPMQKATAATATAATTTSTGAQPEAAHAAGTVTGVHTGTATTAPAGHASENAGGSGGGKPRAAPATHTHTSGTSGTHTHTSGATGGPGGHTSGATGGPGGVVVEKAGGVAWSAGVEPPRATSATAPGGSCTAPPHAKPAATAAGN